MVHALDKGLERRIALVILDGRRLFPRLLAQFQFDSQQVREQLATQRRKHLFQAIANLRSLSRAPGNLEAMPQLLEFQQLIHTLCRIARLHGAGRKLELRFPNLAYAIQHPPHGPARQSQFGRDFLLGVPFAFPHDDLFKSRALQEVQ